MRSTHLSVIVAFAIGVLSLTTPVRAESSEAWATWLADFYVQALNRDVQHIRYDLTPNCQTLIAEPWKLSNGFQHMSHVEWPERYEICEGVVSKRVIKYWRYYLVETFDIMWKKDPTRLGAYSRDGLVAILLARYDAEAAKLTVAALEGWTPRPSPWKGSD